MGPQSPTTSSDIAEHSIGGALVAWPQQVGGEAGTAIAAAAKSAFVDGFHTTSLVAAGFAAVGAIVALIFLPAKATPAPHDDQIDRSTSSMTTRSTWMRSSQS